MNPCVHAGVASGGGGAPSLPSSGLILDLDAAVGVTTSGGLVTSWVDQSPSGLTATTVASYEPTYDATAGPGSTPAVVVTGGQFMVLSSALRPTSGPVTVLVVMDDTSPSNTFRYLIDSDSTRRIIEQITGSGGDTGYYDGAHRHIAASARGEQVLTWTLQNSGGEMYRGRSSLGTGPYTEAEWAGNVVLFADRLGSAQFAHAEVARILVWDRVLSASELTQTWDYVDSIYGVAP
jgi:hypothetical protein